MPDLHDVSVRLAGMLLIQEGEITITEIESLPFVAGRDEALLIARKLVQAFGDQYQVELHDERHSDMQLTLAGTRIDGETLA